ncbi:hypothetical protein [Soonwooa sp.]|uniref:hypothetical protein n=1 Tax=Soonwooa sp. TaxID=1938592 RepID=UPI0028AF6E8F|nr:hypothetical protein [Soonwooa sp.]
MEQNEELKKDEVSPMMKLYIETKRKERESKEKTNHDNGNLPNMEGVSEAMKLYIQSKNKK